MQTMQEILIHDVQPSVIHSCWLVVQLVGIARSSQQSHYLPPKQNIWQLLMLQKKKFGFKEFFKDIGFLQDSSLAIFSDNQSCISLSRNPTFHARTKCVEIQHHFVCEKIESGDISLVFC